jgi:FKBP-type peptidyl-prolyl cis-trans isomerase
MKKWIVTAACAVALAAGVAYTQQPARKAAPAGNLATVGGKASYGIGLNIGTSLKEIQDGGGEIDAELVYQGLKDALAGKDPPVPMEEIQAAMQQFDREMTQKQAEARINANPELKALADKTKKEGEEYLTKNKTKQGVKTTKSGLQYEVVEEGEGKSPTAQDFVTVHYDGKLVDGTTFDSSRQRGQPAQFQVQGVIPGWTEALQMMKPGGKWRLHIPPDLAYGLTPPPGSQIPPNAVLVFDVQLLEVTQQPGQPQAQPQVRPQSQAQQPKKAAKK